jgi:ribosomal protein S27AE
MFQKNEKKCKLCGKIASMVSVANTRETVCGNCGCVKFG